MLRSAGNPQDPAQAADEMQRAEQLLAHLPAEQAEVIRLRVFDGLRLNEIAELESCSVNTVCSRLRYGFRKLRDFVTERQEPNR